MYFVTKVVQFNSLHNKRDIQGGGRFSENYYLTSNNYCTSSHGIAECVRINFV